MEQKNKSPFDAMVGEVFKQPLHKTLRQYRLMTVFVLGCSIDIMYRLLAILEEANRLSEGQQIAAIVGLATALITAIWKGIANLSEPHKEDFKE